MVVILPHLVLPGLSLSMIKYIHTHTQPNPPPYPHTQTYTHKHTPSILTNPPSYMFRRDKWGRQNVFSPNASRQIGTLQILYIVEINFFCYV